MARALTNNAAPKRYGGLVVLVPLLRYLVHFEAVEFLKGHIHERVLASTIRLLKILRSDQVSNHFLFLMRTVFIAPQVCDLSDEELLIRSAIRIYPTNVTSSVETDLELPPDIIRFILPFLGFESSPQIVPIVKSVPLPDFVCCTYEPNIVDAFQQLSEFCSSLSGQTQYSTGLKDLELEVRIQALSHFLKVVEESPPPAFFSDFVSIMRGNSRTLIRELVEPNGEMLMTTLRRLQQDSRVSHEDMTACFQSIANMVGKSFEGKCWTELLDFALVLGARADLLEWRWEPKSQLARERLFGKLRESYGDASVCLRHSCLLKCHGERLPLLRLGSKWILVGTSRSTWEWVNFSHPGLIRKSATIINMFEETAEDAKLFIRSHGLSHL